MLKPHEMPMITNRSAEELDGLLDRIKRNNEMNDEDRSLLVGCVEFASWLPSVLKDKEITIAQLRKALFGGTDKHKKPRDKGNIDKDNNENKDSGCSQENEQVVENGKLDSDQVDVNIPNEASEETDQKNSLDSINQDQTETNDIPKGHGRLGHDAYPNAIIYDLTVEGLQVGDLCPELCGGKLYSLNPGVMLRIVGSPLAIANKYQLQRLRCALCGIVIKASLPADIHPTEKYDYRFKAMLSFQKYYMGIPFYRQEDCQKLVGFPLPNSTQFELCESVANCAYPVVSVLEQEAANGVLLHQDDTPVKILSVIADNKANPNKSRTGMYTTGIISKTALGQMIALFYNSTQHAGEHFKQLLEKRSSDREKIIQMCDALSANMPKGLRVIICNCLAHGFRKFRDLLDYYPESCLHVMTELSKVYRFDEQTVTMTPKQRLAYHRKWSKPVMLKLNRWLKKQLTDKLTEPNSHLGRAIRYMIKNWKKLRRFLTTPGAPLDNNILETALKIPIRIRKEAMFYKTEHGATVGGLLLSLIYTAKLSNENPIDYLVALQENKPAVFANPKAWVPWRYQQTLSELQRFPKAA